MSSDLGNLLKNHTYLYASFDKKMDADISRGSGQADAQPTVLGAAENTCTVQQDSYR